VDLPLAKKDRPGLDLSVPTRPVVIDSYGHEFQLVVDTDGDSLIKVPHQIEPLKERIAVWSAGRDGVPGNADDFCSWQRQK
jgi:soluble P-type ATPase